MRKILWALLAVLLLGGCGGNSWERAYEKAERLVADWNAAELNCCRYEGRAEELAGERCYVVVMTPSRDAVGQQLSEEQLTRCVQSLTPDVQACFERERVSVVCEVYDVDGQLLYVFVNGTPVT